MKRRSCIALALLLLLSVITGCTKETPAETTFTDEQALSYLTYPVVSTTVPSTDGFEETEATKESDEWGTEPPDDPDVLPETGSGTAGEDPLLIPWQLNAAEQAKKDGKVHYWFMSSEGQPMVATAIYPEKWGDACLMALPDGKLILIDTGHKLYAPTLVKNLLRLGVQKLDYILISHFHSDHTGGLTETGGILDNFAVGQVYAPNVQYTLRSQVESACAKKNVPIQFLLQGDNLTLGQLTMQVLWPERDAAGTKLETTEQVNNGSMVVRLDYQGHSALFTGDIYTETENKLASQYPELLNVDLLKAPHHGDLTSNSLNLAKATKPEIVVATGYLNINSNVYAIYENLSAMLLCDKQEGYIHITAKGSTLTWESGRAQ